VKKILGLLVLALAFTLTLGSQGCNPKKEEKETPAKAMALESIDDAKIGAKTTKDVTVKLNKATDKELTLKIEAKKGDKVEKKITGEGTIAKEKKEGKLTITTDGAPADDYTVTVTAGDLTTKFKLKVEAAEETPTIKMQDIKGTVEIGKKESKDVPIELTGKAEKELKLEITAKKGDETEKTITGKGTIAKGAEKGDLTITTVETPPGEYMIWVSSGELKTSFKLKVK
jgi:hypothetical protein